MHIHTQTHTHERKKEANVIFLLVSNKCTRNRLPLAIMLFHKRTYSRNSILPRMGEQLDCLREFLASASTYVSNRIMEYSGNSICSIRKTYLYGPSLRIFSIISFIWYIGTQTEEMESETQCQQGYVYHNMVQDSGAGSLLGTTITLRSLAGSRKIS